MDRLLIAKRIRILIGLCFAFILGACGSETRTQDKSISQNQTTTIEPTGFAKPPGELDEQILSEDTGSVAITNENAGASAEIYAALREEMVQDGVIAWGVNQPDVLEAMRIVPRHEFVPDEYLSQAYENHPLPIGFGQTISQPYIVGLMTEAAGVKGGDQVLEIGTGSGYQAAILAELVDHVHSIEIIGPLAERAETTHARLGYDNITIYNADGYFGLEEQAPFDAIVVTAAPDHIPQPLVQQLKIGGRMIIPVGPVGGFQTLWLITRISEDEIRTQNLGGVRFVPLTREVE